MLEDSLAKLVSEVQENVIRSCEQSRLDPSLCGLLGDTAREFFDKSGGGDFAQPLGLYFATYRSFGKNTDEVARLVGEFLCFYLLAGDAFDDVEDGDSHRKPFGRDGVPIATNAALMFIVLGLDALGRAIEACGGSVQGARLIRVFNDVSITGVSAQHVDLVGALRSRADVLALHKGKASSLALLTECGAVVAGASSVEAGAMREIGYKFAQIVQIVDDVRDMFGSDVSSDLRDDKATYPRFCLYELLSEAGWAEYRDLVEHCDTAEGLDRVRAIYHDSGALDLCAEKMDELRQEVHTLVSRLPNPGAYHRLLLEIVDALSGTLYEPEELDVSAPVRAVEGPLAKRLRREACGFMDHVDWGDGEAPALRPWHLPFFLFSPSERRIYFPDLDGLAPEILPFYAELLGTTLSDVEQLVPQIAPFFMAHEHVHARRCELGLLTDDTWHEEVLANAYALAYVSEHAPEVAEALLQYAERLLGASAPSPALREQAERLLEEGLVGPAPEGRDYGHSAVESAQIYALHLTLLPELDLEELRVRCFGISPSVSTAFAAA
jgi:geranylgeranyl pyrophosphate synthase